MTMDTYTYLRSLGYTGTVAQMDLAYRKDKTRPVDKGAWVDVKKDFNAVGDGVTDDTAAFQAAIDSLIVGAAVTTVASSAPITIPVRNGGIVMVPPGEYLISTITLADLVTIQGAGRGQSKINVSGSIRYATAHNTAFDTTWGIGLKDLRICGVVGTETLVGPGVVTDVTVNRTEHVLTEANFDNVLFEHGGIGFDLRGWNNHFNNCWFRDFDIGINADTAAKRVNLNSPVANPGDNVFNGCTFNDCGISVKARWMKNSLFLDCAPYRCDNMHYFFGESCDGNMILGGRMEDAPNYGARVEGGMIVTNGSSTVYQCIVNHIADAEHEPGVGASWTDYWRVTTEWTVKNYWVLGTHYYPTQATGNIWEGVDCYYGQSPRTGRRGATITRSAEYATIKLDGDQHTRIKNCRSGASTDETVEITDRSVSAVLVDNVNIRADFTGSLTPKYSEQYQEYGTGTRTFDHNTEIVKLRQLTMKGETDDYYWVYAAESPRSYQFRSIAGKIAMRVREVSGVIHLPNQTFITDLAAATSTVVSVVNVSSTDVVQITPRNAAAATFYAANLANIYAVPEANDKIRIYHPNTAGAGCTFNVVIL